MEVLKRAWEARFEDAVLARRDPDLTILQGEPDFERLYPALESSQNRQPQD